eukprot:2989910-Rhodomonas_salina.1
MPERQTLWLKRRSQTGETTPSPPQNSEIRDSGLRPQTSCPRWLIAGNSKLTLGEMQRAGGWCGCHGSADSEMTRRCRFGSGGPSQPEPDSESHGDSSTVTV